MAEFDPAILGDDLHQILLDLHGIGVFCEIEALGNARNVGIHDNARRYPVSGSEHHVGSLASGPGNREHLFHGFRHGAVKLAGDALRGADDGLGLVVEEAGAANIVCQHLGADGSEILWRGVFLEQSGGDFVDALIGALRREDGGDEQFPRVAMQERARGVGVHAVEPGENFGDSGLALGCGFGTFHVSWTLVMRARWILLAAALVAFGASLGSGFHFDDYAIFSDPALQSGRGWLEVWAPLQSRPLTYFTFWLNRVLGEGDPLGYHLFNLVFHLIAVLLAWECLRRLLPERVALLAGVIFALHPLQAEAVNYVWARSIVLAAACCFAALWMWLEGRPWIAVACFALGLLAKEECAAFPLFLLWLSWNGSLPGVRRSRSALAVMFALAMAAGARVIWATSVIPGAPAGVQAGISPLKYLVAQGAAICRYVQLFVLPYGFTVDAEIPRGVWVGLGGWAVIVAITVYLVRARRTFAVWWIAGLLLLLPSSSIFPAADLAADRRMYLPMFAFAVLAAMVVSHWEARVRAPQVTIVVALVLVALSVSRTLVWMSEQRLWAEAVERAPGKLRPKLQLARALPAAKGLELLSKARLQSPYEPAIATEIGKILMSEGQVDGALEEFGRALALAPTDARNMNNRGVALQALGQTEAARADFLRALRTDPSLVEAKENLAKLPPAQ